MGLTLCTELGKKSGFYSHSSIAFSEEFVEDEIPEHRRWATMPEIQKTKLKPKNSAPGVQSMPQLFERKPLNPDRGRKKKHKHVPSLMERLQENEKNPIDHFAEGEYQAELYMDAVQDDSILQVTNTLDIANSMIEKGNDVTDELERQRKVMHKANNDINITEQEINDTNYILNGMKSLTGKFSNLVWKKPKNKAQDMFDSVRVLNKTDQNRVKAAPLAVPARAPAEDKQKWLNQSVTTLCSAMDIIQVQQLDIKEELEHQEANMGKFGNNMDRVEEKIKNQTHLMQSIG